MNAPTHHATDNAHEETHQRSALEEPAKTGASMGRPGDEEPGGLTVPLEGGGAAEGRRAMSDLEEALWAELDRAGLIF